MLLKRFSLHWHWNQYKDVVKPRKAVEINKMQVEVFNHGAEEIACPLKMYYLYQLNFHLFQNSINLWSQNLYSKKGAGANSKKLRPIPFLLHVSQKKDKKKPPKNRKWKSKKLSNLRKTLSYM